MANVIVTGASRGIGLATALELARAGHAVYGTMRKPAQSPALAETAKKEALPVKIFTMDVDWDQSVSECMGKILAEAGQIDALVNNAGVERTGSIEELPMEAFRSTMETNYFGALRCIRAVLPAMRERRSGCIVNVTSVAGRISASPLGPYNASKWALEAASEALAQEMKTFGVRVAIVEPGIIDTAMARRIVEPTGSDSYPQGRRIAGMFQASLSSARPPSIVAEKIRDVIESGTWKLRHTVGPDAEPFLNWRAAMTDEEWVEWGALDDEAWYERVQQDFGFDARPKTAAASKG
jgi:NAD(P)-dependent dehydrogenase (short-subunit alcohol dehydrogenase family)